MIFEVLNLKKIIKSVDYKFDAGISYVSVENIKLIT